MSLRAIATRTLALLSLLALLAAPRARAGSVYMWGVGGGIGTLLVPARYPLSWPPAVGDDGGMDKVRGDLILKGQGYYWADKHSRLGLGLSADLGSGYQGYELDVGYDRMEPTSALDYLYGAGIGVGLERWKTGERLLRVPEYPLRGQVGVLVRDGQAAYQGVLFARFAIPGLSEYTDASGATQEVGWGFYGAIGIELSVYYGDFTPPKKKKSKKKSSKKSSSSSSSSKVSGKASKKK